MPLIVDGITGVTFNDSSLQGAAASPFGLKNRIINGDMVIDQRNAGASVTGNDAVFGVDRWKAIVSQSSKFTMQQNAGSVTPPSGFTNYFGCTSSSAYTVGSAETFNIAQFIEGFNTADLGWGAAGAASITLSFWVRSSLTGTFGGSVQNSASNRSYPFTYSIAAANTWEQKTVTIAGDTSGTWIGATNGIGLRVNFGLGVGSTFSGTAGAWAGSDLDSATGAVSVVGTNGATFYITGVQLEKGSTATSFDYLDYGRSLMQCQRYFEKSQPQGSAVAGGTSEYFFVGSNFRGSSVLMRYPLKWSVTKRAQPTITFYNPRPSGTASQITTASADYSGTTAANVLDSGTEVQGTTNSGGASGDPAYVNWTSSAEL